MASQPEEVRQFFIFRKKRDATEETDYSEEPEMTTLSPNEEQIDPANYVNCTWTVKVLGLTFSHTEKSIYGSNYFSRLNQAYIC